MMILFAPRQAEFVLPGDAVVLKRVPCWFGIGFDYGECRECERYATEIIRSPWQLDWGTGRERCVVCGALLLHYVMSVYYPFTGEKQRPIVLPHRLRYSVARQVFLYDDHDDDYAQVFLETERDQVTVHTYGFPFRNT